MTFFIEETIDKIINYRQVDGSFISNFRIYYDRFFSLFFFNFFWLTFFQLDDITEKDRALNLINGAF